MPCAYAIFALRFAPRSGCRLLFELPTLKLRDLNAMLLLANLSPFVGVTAAHWRAQRTIGQVEE